MNSPSAVNKSRNKKLQERQSNQEEARARQATLAGRLVSHLSKKRNQEEAPRKAPELPAAPANPLPVVPRRPWAPLRSGDAGLRFFERVSGNELRPQPWATSLVSTVLQAAEEGGVHLCLTWPASLSGVSLLHALATLERNLAKDLYGLRTVQFPATYASRAPLQAVLADLIQLSDFCRSFWTQTDQGVIRNEVQRNGPVRSLFEALNNIRNWSKKAANPSLAELVPAFICESAQAQWTPIVAHSLQRSLAKISDLGIRKSFRAKLEDKWSDPSKAPDALLLIHHSSKKDVWKKALSARALQGAGAPEVLLLDATRAAERRNANSIWRIPEFLKCATEAGHTKAGAVIVTDEPKTFFVLRAELAKSKRQFLTHVFPSEADAALLSQHPLQPGWAPALRTNANFDIGIVDREAYSVAQLFQRLAHDVATVDSSAQQVLLDGCFYLLRLSNLPAGYSDLTAFSAENPELEFSNRRNAWTTVLLQIQGCLESGAINAWRSRVDQAICKAEGLIDAWRNGTPMAERLLRDVRRHAVASREGIIVVLPNDRYISLANRFLERRLGQDWSDAEARIDWHTLSSVGKTFDGDRKGKHLLFVGLNSNVMRLLIAHPDIPHGTGVLVAYHQAEATRKTLLAMKLLDELKAYRGRIGLLLQQLERRLDEIPAPTLLERLGDISLTFPEERERALNPTDSSYFTFELENGRTAYASGWVYRYEPDEDPCFKRTSASSIRDNDCIFEIGDALRSRLESLIDVSGGDLGSIVKPGRVLLKLYHNDVKSRCELFFGSKRRAALARAIHHKMVELDSSAVDCRIGRVYYWLALPADGDTRPHAARDQKYFMLFCRALEISNEMAKQYWDFIRNARVQSQAYGRELASRYAQIIFQPESALVYRNINEETIKDLQQEALNYVYRVERVIPPVQAKEA